MYGGADVRGGPVTEEADSGGPRRADTARAPSRRTFRWTKGLAVTVAILLAVPVVLGVAVGLFEINPVAAEVYSTVGEDAHLLLDGFPDNTLVVEFAYQQSAGPPPSSAVATLLDRINETCQKATVALDEHPFSAPTASFDDAQLLSLVEQNRQHWTVPGTATLFYLYLAGSYAPDPSVIGLAFRASSIAVFEGTIASEPTLAGNPTGYTTTVLVHEFGHELGLVGIYGSAPNEDLAHPPHSNDPNDVMYWEVDSTKIGLLGGGPPTQFDAADMSDLSHVRSAVIPLEVLPWVLLAVCVLLAAYWVLHDGRAGPRRGAQP